MSGKEVGDKRTWHDIKSIFDVISSEIANVETLLKATTLDDATKKSLVFALIRARVHCEQVRDIIGEKLMERSEDV